MEDKTMGTRGLIMVYANSEFKVAQYSQWDNYPEGNGQAILNFLRDFDGEYKYLKKTMGRVTEAPEKEIGKSWVECGAPQDGDGFVSLEIADKHTQAYPEWSRDTGAKILPLILSRQGYVALRRSIDFAADSLFCEWAYVIDLDIGTFTVFKGFNQEPLDEKDRFYFLQDNAEDWTPPYEGAERYYPIRALISWPLEALPTVEEFLEATNTEKDEEVAP
jgi:hypothetical protein